MFREYRKDDPVLCNGEYVRVTAIQQIANNQIEYVVSGDAWTHKEKELTSIPLDEEVLRKCGFRQCVSEYHFTREDIRIVYHLQFKHCYIGKSGYENVECLHELKHLIEDLTDYKVYVSFCADRIERISIQKPFLPSR